MAARFNTHDLMSDFTSSGLTQKAFCLRTGMSISTLAYHLKKHKQRTQKPGPDSPATPSFVPVEIKNTDSGKSCTLIVLKGEFSCTELKNILSSHLQ